MDELLDNAFQVWLDYRDIYVRDVRGIAVLTTEDPFGQEALIANPDRMLAYFVGLN